MTGSDTLGELVLKGRQLSRAAAANERIDPAEIDEPDANLEGAAPIDTDTQRICVTPIEQPAL